MAQLTVNGQVHEVDAPPDMPLLWVLRDLLKLTGTKFGCGIAQCGACTVHVDGAPLRSCLLPISAIGSRAVTTIEAVGATPDGAQGAAGLAGPGGDPVRLLPVGPDHVGRGPAGRDAEPGRRRHRRRHGRQHLSLRHLCAHPRGDQARGQGRLREARSWPCSTGSPLRTTRTPSSPAAPCCRSRAAAGGGLLVGFLAPVGKAAGSAGTPGRRLRAQRLHPHRSERARSPWSCPRSRWGRASTPRSR